MCVHCTAVASCSPSTTSSFIPVCIKSFIVLVFYVGNWGIYYYCENRLMDATAAEDEGYCFFFFLFVLLHEFMNPMRRRRTHHVSFFLQEGLDKSNAFCCCRSVQFLRQGIKMTTAVPFLLDRHLFLGGSLLVSYILRILLNVDKT